MFKKLITKERILDMIENEYSETVADQFESYGQKLITEKLEERFEQTLTAEQKKLYNDFMDELLMYYGERELEALRYGINFIQCLLKL